MTTVLSQITTALRDKGLDYSTDTNNAAFTEVILECHRDDEGLQGLIVDTVRAAMGEYPLEIEWDDDLVVISFQN